MWDEYIIVDDNRFDRIICARMVDKIDPDATFVEFSNGNEVLDYLISDLFSAQNSLIFLDINMPVMSGFDFLAALRKHSKGAEIESRIHVAFITSSSRSEDKEIAAQYEYVIGFVQKPLLAECVADAVRKKI